MHHDCSFLFFCLNKTTPNVLDELTQAGIVPEFQYAH